WTPPVAWRSSASATAPAVRRAGVRDEGPCVRALAEVPARREGRAPARQGARRQQARPAREVASGLSRRAAAGEEGGSVRGPSLCRVRGPDAASAGEGGGPLNENESHYCYCAPRRTVRPSLPGKEWSARAQARADRHAHDAHRTTPHAVPRRRRTRPPA